METSVKEYVPSPHKRFEVSKDENSRARIKDLNDVVKDIQNNLLFTDEKGVEQSLHFGLTLGGSLAKGKVLTDETASLSDIDLILYVDVDDENLLLDFVRLHPDSEIAKEFENTTVSYRELFGPTKYLPPESDEEKSRRERQYAIENTLSNYVSKKILQKLSDRKDALRLEILPNFSSATSTVQPIALSGSWSILSRVSSGIANMEYEGMSRGYGNTRQYNIAALWRLDVGGGMKRYRIAFFEQLQKLEREIAEKHWGIVAEAVNLNERKKNIPETMKGKFPQTLDEAFRYFGVPVKL